MTVPPRLRFAPSPTGYLHVGGARTALFNWLHARHTGGSFLLRVEDTDRARSTDESTRAIFHGLRWLGLDWDEEVVFQGANLERHRADAYALLEGGHAYRDFTTAAELDAMRRDAESQGRTFTFDRRLAEYDDADLARRLERGDHFTIRFRVPGGTTAWSDLVHGTVSFPNKDIDDFIILRSDGTPIYNHAVVSDDIAMRITLVMRGDDHISNTPKQILLYRARGAALPEFAHLPNVNGTDGRKLSKRHGATAVGDYEQMGIVPEAMRNFLALLGWSPGDDREIMTQDELIRAFTPAGLLAKAAVFDLRKLEWMNGQYLASMPVEELDARLRPALAASGVSQGAEIAALGSRWHHLLGLLQVRARTITDLVRQCRPFLGEPELDPAAAARHWEDAPATADLLQGCRDAIAASDWDATSLEAGLRQLAESRDLGPGKLFQPLRVALTGSAESPGIFDVLLVLGRDRSVARLDAAISRLRAPAGA